MRSFASKALLVLLVAGTGSLWLSWTGRIPGGTFLRNLVEDPVHRAGREHREHRTRLRAAHRKESTPPEPLVFLGSSTIERWPLREAFPRARAVNRGIGAETAAEMAERIAELPGDARGFVIYAGSRELRTTSRSPAEIGAGIAHLLEALRARFPKAPVFLLGVLSEQGIGSTDRARLTELNGLLRAGAPHFGAVFVETDAAPLTGEDGSLASRYAADTWHLNADGYGVLARMLSEAPGARELIDRPPAPR